MKWKTKKPEWAEASGRRFLLGPPQDSDDLLQLFSLVLEKADLELRAGKQFGVPFAAFLKLANRSHPSSDYLAQFCSNKDWRPLFRNVALSAAGAAAKPAVVASDNRPSAMFPDLLQFALESAPVFNLEGPQLCRLLAAVGQTLDAKDRRFRLQNRSLADRHRAAARHRILPPSKPGLAVQNEQIEVAAPAPVPVKKSQIVVMKQPPWQIDFRCAEEEATCLRLDGIVLWHASYIGPRSADKSENQDATFAMTTPEMSSPPNLVFALADGVTTSLGSRLAATLIVRRFCELVLRQLGKGEHVTGSDLIQAARETQVSLEELTKTLLHDANSRGFEVMLGHELTPKVATRVLENTLNPKVAAMPSALNATLIGGVAQPNGSPGGFQIELLRIGDGSVEHIDAKGDLTSVLDTDSSVMAISESLGPGPQSRALFEQGVLSTKTVMLGKGDSLIVSSDGLARGHELPISQKLSELLGEQFWQKARAEEPDAALQILHRACDSADELFRQDAKRNLFADNVSLIVIRSGD
jgi:serine/threonine protein phosphatase PrpC